VHARAYQYQPDSPVREDVQHKHSPENPGREREGHRAQRKKPKRCVIGHTKVGHRTEEAEIQLRLASLTSTHIMAVLIDQVSLIADTKLVIREGAIDFHLCHNHGSGVEVRRKPLKEATQRIQEASLWFQSIARSSPFGVQASVPLAEPSVLELLLSTRPREGLFPWCSFRWLPCDR
jgi:hypothetical protein